VPYANPSRGGERVVNIRGVWIMTRLRWRYAKLLPYALRQWPILIAIGCLTGFASVVGALQPWPMKLLVDCALQHQPLPWRLQQLTAAAGLHASARVLVIAAALSGITLFVGSSAIGAALDWAWTVAGQRMANHLAGDLFQHYTHRSLLLHHRDYIGDALSRLTGDAWSIHSLTATLLMSPLANVATLVAVGLLSWRLEPKLAMLSLLLAPFLGATSLFFGRALKRRAKFTRQAQSRITSFVQQTLSSLSLVQAFATTPDNRKSFERLANDAIDWSQRGALTNSLYGMASGLITTLGSAIVLLVGGRRVLSGTLTVGGLLVFVTYMRNLQSAAEGLLRSYATLKPIEASLDRALEVLEDERLLPEKPRPLLLAPRPGGQRVAVENVTFGYDPGLPVLADLSLIAERGETVALVGETGAGKSTLACLIPRLFDPWKGRVCIDGVDIRNMRIADVRGRVSMVLQEPYLLPISVAENIAYSRPGSSRVEIVAAAKAARAHDFIEALPNGYNTVIDERGCTLSGGEKQRLSVARALLKDADIMIFDEPTSALDAQTEAALLEVFQRLIGSRTTFIIAHRLSTIRRAGKIAFLRGGRIVEAGTPEELLGARGAFYSYYSTQFSTPGVTVAGQLA